MTSAKDSTVARAAAGPVAVSVMALGPVRHGVTKDGVTTFHDLAEGDSLEVADQAAADRLVATGGFALTPPGVDAVADQAAQQDQPHDAEAIDKANAKADKDRGKTAAKEAKDQA